MIWEDQVFSNIPPPARGLVHCMNEQVPLGAQEAVWHPGADANTVVTVFCHFHRFGRGRTPAKADASKLKDESGDAPGLLPRE